jgi:hypothetical protein
MAASQEISLAREEEAPRTSPADDRSFSCPFCSFVTNDPAEFRRHIQEEHPDRAD